MSTIPLIFPCVLSDQQFNVIKEELSILDASLKALSSIDRIKVKIDSMDFRCLMADIREIIAYKNCKGYRFNSYLIRLSILKAEYVIEIAQREHLPFESHVVTTLVNFTFRMSLVLETAFKSQYSEIG